MKIYYIANIKLPTEKAHGYQIVKMGEELAKKQEIELVIPGRESHLKDDVFDYYEIKKTYKIRKIGSFDFIKWEPYLGKLAFNIQKFLFLVKLLKEKFDKQSIIYTREAEVAWLMSKRGFSVYYEAHNWSERSRLHIRMLKQVKGIISITEGLKMEYKKRGFRDENILVAADGVDINKFEIKNSKTKIREELGLPIDKKIAVYVGSFHKWKGVDTLVEVAKKMDQVLFVLVGGVGELKNPAYTGRGKEDNIMAVGQKNRDELPKWMAGADVLVLPNSGKERISRLYTSPIKMFEYMASKRPIVASDLPSIREILNEENAMLVEPDSMMALKKGLEIILSDKKMGEEKAEKAFKKVKDYTWEKRAEKIIRFLDL